MASHDSPGSPLSDIDSDEFTEDPKFDRRSRDDTVSMTNSQSASTPLPMHSSKRRRIGASSYDHRASRSSTVESDTISIASISSDTSGEVPMSPSFANLGPTHPLATAYAALQSNPDDPDAAETSQITRCLWAGCTDPDQGNMDNLVDHIQDEHLSPGMRKYNCEWEGCSRKGAPHTSGYALRAHMRSHTREKPFYCALPECDRSFTRSDALAKHMRTVHETEALRPSDPVPKNHSANLGGAGSGAAANGGPKRIKLIVNNGDKPKSVVADPPPLPFRGIAREDGDADPVDIDSCPFELPVPPEYYPSDISMHLDNHERVLPPSQWFRLLRRQIHWAEKEGSRLEKELAVTIERSVAEEQDAAMIQPSGKSIRGESNREMGWRHTEAILDDVLGKEVGHVLDMFGGRTESAKEADPWSMVRGMEALVG